MEKAELSELSSYSHNITKTINETIIESHGCIENNTRQNIDKTCGTQKGGDLEKKLFHLPLARIRSIMKLDSSFQVASNEAVFVIAKATELFIESLSLESLSYMMREKKKTLQRRDVDLAVSAIDSLMFLDGTFQDIIN